KDATRPQAQGRGKRTRAARLLQFRGKDGGNLGTAVVADGRAVTREQRNWAPTFMLLEAERIRLTGRRNEGMAARLVQAAQQVIVQEDAAQVAVRLDHGQHARAQDPLLTG